MVFLLFLLDIWDPDPGGPKLTDPIRIRNTAEIRRKILTKSKNPVFLWIRAQATVLPAESKNCMPRRPFLDLKNLM